MITDKPSEHQTPCPGTVDAEEQRAWVGFYHQVGRDPALAAELMAHLDTDADARRRHLALYLSCKQSVRLHKARQNRDRRIALGLRQLAQAMVLRPFALVSHTARVTISRCMNLLAESVSAGRSSGTVATKRTLAAAQPVMHEPPALQTPTLVQTGGLADAQQRLRQQTRASARPHLADVDAQDSLGETSTWPRPRAKAIPS